MAQIFNIESAGNGYYKIVHGYSGKVFDVEGGIAQSGVNVQLYEWNGTNAQLWKFVSDGNGYYYIKNKLGYYLDVASGTVMNGQNIWVYTGNKSSAQKFKLNAYTGSSSTTNWDSLVGKTVANIGSKYYTTDNMSYNAGYKGQCTWYAYGRFYEVTGIKLEKARHAKYWLSDNASNSKVTVTNSASAIKAKTIAVRTSGQYGHVMFVENVTYNSNGSPAYVYFTECNADGNGVYDVGTDCIVKKLTYASFINSKNPTGYISAR
jgi:surface antigen